MDTILTCQFNKCNKYFLSPVHLRCSKSVCQKHIKEIVDSGAEKFICEFCNQEHQIPSNDFPQSKELEAILNLNWHLNDNQKSAAIH